LGISRIHSDVFTVISNVNCQIYRFRKSISDFFNPFLLDRSGKIIFNLYLDLIENTRNTSVISIANNDSETILQGTINLAKTPSKLITKINNPNKYVTLAGNRWQANTIFEGNQVPTNFQVHRVQTTDTSFNNDQPLFATIEYLSSQANIFNSSSEIRCRITNAESLNSIIDITSDETRLFLEGRFVTTAENLITIDI
jgi:hypothetical protein